MVRKRRGDVSAVAGWPHTCCSFEFIIIDYLYPSFGYCTRGNERKSALPSDSPRTEIILYFTKRVDKLINDCGENVDG